MGIFERTDYGSRDMTLSEYLKVAEESATEFAARTGISQPYVSRLVRRERFPRHDIIERIREATKGKVTADDLMPLSNSERAQERLAG